MSFKNSNFQKVIDLFDSGRLDAFEQAVSILEQVDHNISDLIEKLDQIQRLSQTANPELVNVPAMLGDIARDALASVKGGAA